MQLQKITWPKVLILSIATYAVVSGRCCQWFRSVRHSLRASFRHNNEYNRIGDDDSSSSRKAQSKAAHLRTPGRSSLHHSKVTHVDAMLKEEEDDTTTPSSYSGIWFSKSVEVVNDITPNANPIEFEFDDEQQHCQGVDQDGNSVCHYEWGDVVSIHYSLNDSSDDESWNDTVVNLSESARVKGTFTINDKMSWTFSCGICGQDCQLDYGLLAQSLGGNVSMQVTECSSSSSSNNDSRLHGSLLIALPSPPTTSDDKMKMMMPLALKGSLEVYSQPNELLAQIGMSATIA